MTEQETLRHRKWLMQKYGDIDGEDIFQQAWIYAMQGYENIEKVNQSLFSKLCKWAARELKKHERYEIPFSCLQRENEDREEFAEFDFADPTWEKQYVAIEEREDLQKIYGQWLLNALLSATESKTIPAREEEKEEEQLKFEFA
jgi:DNA-directed RNA polymerase specialized sigma24 family protein